MLLFWGAKKNRTKDFDGTRQGLKNSIYQTRQSEFGHLADFVLIPLLALVFLFKDYYLLNIFFMAINILGNIFAIFLQRQPRIRIDKIANRL